VKINVELFSTLRLAIGRWCYLDLPEGATVAEAMNQFMHSIDPVLHRHIVDSKRDGYLVAIYVDGQPSDSKTKLLDGQVIALLPPISGGGRMRSG
jgi:molybdopterin converting factor small subunit